MEAANSTKIHRVEEEHGDYTFVVERRDGRLVTFKQLVGHQQPEADREYIAPDELPSAYLRQEYQSLSISV